MSEYNRGEQGQALGWPLNGPCDGDPGTLFQWSWQRLRVQCAPHNQPSFLASYEIPAYDEPTVHMSPQERQAFVLLCGRRHTVSTMADALGTGPRQARVVMERLRDKGAADRQRAYKNPHRPGPAPWSYKAKRCTIDMTDRRKNARRNAGIRRQHGQGATVKRLATYHDLSTTRIYQILEEPSA